MTPTEIMLLAVHRTPAIPLADICEKMFGLCHDEARRQAALNTLPVPAWRASGSRQGPLLVRLTELAAFVDSKSTNAAASWTKSQV